jgi:hypothetical protein
MAPSAKRASGPTYRRILKTLAAAPHGCDVNTLLSSGFEFATISDLVRAGFAAAQLETTKVSGRTVDIARLRITDAGRKRLELVSTAGAPTSSDVTSPAATSVVEADASMAEAPPFSEAGPAIPHAVEPDGRTAGTMHGSEAMLAAVIRHVAEGEALVSRMKVVIAKTRELGLGVDFAENLLDTMLETLSLMNDVKAGIEARLKRGNLDQDLAAREEEAALRLSGRSSPTAPP